MAAVTAVYFAVVVEVLDFVQVLQVVVLLVNHFELVFLLLINKVPDH